MDSVFDQRFAKVDDQTEFEVLQSQVGKQLSSKDWVVLCNGFAFDDDEVGRGQDT